MARSDPQINFRIPQELKDALDVAAAENRRSLTAEVVSRLQASLNITAEDVAFRSAFKDALPSGKLEQLKSDLQLPTKMIPLIDAEKSLKQYQEHLEAVLAKRDEKIRSWWQQEFGYDPQAPKVDRPPNKVPAPSPNARKTLPKKPAK